MGPDALDAGAPTPASSVLGGPATPPPSDTGGVEDPYADPNRVDQPTTYKPPQGIGYAAPPQQADTASGLMGAAPQYQQTAQNQNMRSSKLSEQRVVTSPAYDRAEAGVAAAQAKATEAVAQSAESSAALSRQAAMNTIENVNQLTADDKAQQAKDAAFKAQNAKIDAQIEADTATWQAQAKSLDPDRLLSTGSNRVVASIAVAFGALGAAILGKNNSAMANINAAIDRDYAAQKDRVASARDKISLSAQSLQRARTMYQDETQAYLQHKANMQGIFLAKMEAMKLQWEGDQGIQARANEAIAQLNVSYSETKARLASLRNVTQAREVASTTAGTTTTANVIQKPKDAAERKDLVEQEAKLTAMIGRAREYAKNNQSLPGMSTASNAAKAVGLGGLADAASKATDTKLESRLRQDMSDLGLIVSSMLKGSVSDFEQGKAIEAALGSGDTEGFVDSLVARRSALRTRLGAKDAPDVTSESLGGSAVKEQQ